ncbi:MAG: hypothetical protein ACXVCH_16045 [Bdellovibrionota bacterium]
MKIHGILPRLVAVFLLLSLPLNSLAAEGGGGEPHNVGFYIPVSFGGQYSFPGWGINTDIGFGIRIFYIGLGVEGSYFYNWGPLAGTFPGANDWSAFMALGRLDIYPVGDLKIGALGGYSWLSSSSVIGSLGTTVIGGRLGYEFHAGRSVAFEPAFTYMHSIGPNQLQTLTFDVKLSLWNWAAIFALLFRGRFH